ncbi:type II toxin-antitoxin system VapC family toxin [Candidatus Woesearchaeota archaeon]|nr:type II toxin-antitoxin system VapC family toxin [Candidatus Woesearchaeota archaeon]
MAKFVDANVLVKAFTENADKDKCQSMLYEDFVTNTLCLVEAQYRIAKIKKDKTYAWVCIKALLKTHALIVPLDRNLLFESLKRAEKYNLNTFDLINYATALVNNCSEFISYDKDFDGLEIKRVEP